MPENKDMCKLTTHFLQENQEFFMYVGGRVCVGVLVCQWRAGVLVLVCVGPCVCFCVGELVRQSWGFAGDIEETDSAGEGRRVLPRS